MFVTLFARLCWQPTIHAGGLTQAHLWTVWSEASERREREIKARTECCCEKGKRCQTQGDSQRFLPLILILSSTASSDVLTGAPAMLQLGVRM